MPTTHQVAELLGSFLETLGTFLLAVEAIKLPNLRAVRERLFKPILNRLSPRIFVRGDEPPETIARLKEQAEFRFLLILATLTFVLVLLTMSSAGESPGALWTALWSTMTASSLWLTVPVALFLAWCMFGVCMIVGFVLYSIALLPFRLSFATLEWIEANTANGIIGILGFLLFLVGSTVHAYFRWAAP